MRIGQFWFCQDWDVDAKDERRDIEITLRELTENLLGSLNWTRTNNLPVNSRLLCQLSYQGMEAKL